MWVRPNFDKFGSLMNKFIIFGCAKELEWFSKSKSSTFNSYFDAHNLLFLYIVRTSTSSNLFLPFKNRNEFKNLCVCVCVYVWEKTSHAIKFCANRRRKTNGSSCIFFFPDTLSTPSWLFLGFLVECQTLFTLLLEKEGAHARTQGLF